MHFLDKPISFDDAQQAIYHQPAPLDRRRAVPAVARPRSPSRSSSRRRRRGAVRHAVWLSRAKCTRPVLRQQFRAQRPGRRVPVVPRVRRVDPRAPGVARRAGATSPAGSDACAGADVPAHSTAIRCSRRSVACLGHGRRRRAVARPDYLALGVRQSIFAVDLNATGSTTCSRSTAAWLAEAQLYDLNLVAHDWLTLACTALRLRRSSMRCRTSPRYSSRWS
jgi:hypothetical protein